MSHSKQAEGPSHHVPSREALQVARYVTDMTAQLEAMALVARLDLLAYFLSMAKAEGGLCIRGNAQADGSGVESREIGPVDPEADSDNPLG
jgi:hypothetical protein